MPEIVTHVDQQPDMSSVLDQELYLGAVRGSLL